MSGETPAPEAIREFWIWFAAHAAELSGRGNAANLQIELDARVERLSPRLSWEFGPGLVQPRQLVISPDLDREMRDAAREVVRAAPEIPRWEIHAARQPKDWNYQFQLDASSGKTVPVDASQWSFVLLQHPDGSLEILLQGAEALKLDTGDRRQAAAIALESILGEEALLVSNAVFELVPELEPRFAMEARPIKDLREAALPVFARR